MDSDGNADVLNSKTFLNVPAERYIGDSAVDRRDPLVSALYAEKEDLKRLPPHSISVAKADTMADHGLRMTDKLKSLGVATVVEVHEGLQHAFEIGVGTMPEASEAVRSIERWVQAQCVDAQL
jgi:acetyl esterase/lipase